MSDTLTYNYEQFPTPLPAAELDQPAQGRVTHTIINPSNLWEVAVGQRIAEELADTHGHILTGLEVSDLRNRIVEIDNLLICDRGIFVIECKGLRGRIEGGLNLPWRAVHADAHAPIVCHRGINPRHQCRQQMFAVIEALERIGVRRQVWVNGAVIVPDEAELDLGSIPVDVYSRTGCPVYHLSAFVRTLTGMPRLTTLCGDPEELARIIEKLRQ
jgi:hypothetical protein